MNLTIPCISKLSNTKLFFLCFFFILLSDFLIAQITGYFDEDALLGLEVDNSPFGLFRSFLTLVILTPFIETLIYQDIVIQLLLWLRIRPLIAITVSALFFAVSHYYNVYYMLAILPSGFLFAAYYYVLKMRKDSWYALLIITLLHALLNLVAFLGNNFL